MSGPYLADNVFLRMIDIFLRRALRLESGANIFPLAHVFIYFYIFVLLLIPGQVSSPYLFTILYVIMLILGYSLSIGIMHMHAHRKLFTHPILNRLIEFILCFPTVLSYPMMLYVHVHLHHKYENGSQDPTCTMKYRKGWPAVWYWIRYAYVCQSTTIKGLFASDAPRRWKRLRRQYIIDTGGVIAIVFALYFEVGVVRVTALWAIPFILVSINIGFFSWLTHAPARGDSVDGSINTTNRWQNILMHNQGYHVVHHFHPGIHWTQIPSNLDVMLMVDDRLIVSYWVFLYSALRNCRQQTLYDEQYGREWKRRFQEVDRTKRLRMPAMPYFGWI